MENPARENNEMPVNLNVVKSRHVEIGSSSAWNSTHVETTGKAIIGRNAKLSGLTVRWVC
jgi:hypothetical protein